MTPCQRQKKRLRAYLDNELAAIEKKEFESHLDECPDCGDHVRRLKSLRQSLKSLHSIPCDSNFDILLRERIRREMAGKTSRSFVTPAIRWSFAAVAVLTISLGSIRLFDTSQPNQTNAMVAHETSTAQSAIPAGLTSSSDQIQYVMDNFPEDPADEIVAARPKMKSNIKAESGDSTRLDQNYQEITNNIRTVSF